MIWGTNNLIIYWISCIIFVVLLQEQNFVIQFLTIVSTEEMGRKQNRPKIIKKIIQSGKT